VTREIDEAFIEEAVERHQRIDSLMAEIDKVARTVEVTVHSPDGNVRVVVGADGTIKDVIITGASSELGNAHLSGAVRDAVTAAADAAAWARAKLHSETFGGYRPLGVSGKAPPGAVGQSPSEAGKG
jgi:DNA-binding protein YbaB